MRCKFLKLLKVMICRLTLDRNIHRLEFMSQFLIYGHVLSTEEAELYADYELKKNPPTLENFKEQVINIISYYFFFSSSSMGNPMSLFLADQSV